MFSFFVVVVVVVVVVLLYFGTGIWNNFLFNFFSTTPFETPFDYIFRYSNQLLKDLE
jgi:cytoskeletal protein RodZ